MMWTARGAGRRVVGAVFAVAVVSSSFAGPVAAQAVEELAPVMVVLDASGSMKARVTGGGGTKMAAAKGSVRTLVDELPDDARLGLAVYGTATGSSDAEKAAGCKDVRVVHEVGQLDRSALGVAVDGVEPSGYTPIGQSLRTAAAALPADGPRSIVLVSDGEDTCAPPDPCEVAKQLAERGVDLRIHVVGFDVDDTARRQLTCVSQVTGGEYVDARDAGSLTRALHRVGQRALRSYDAAGTPVTGTKGPAGAPTVAPGAYLDRIRPGETRYYAVDVPAGYTLYATASAVSPDDSTDYLVHANRYDGYTHVDCVDRATGVKTDGPVVTAALRWVAPDTPGAGGPCDRPGPQLVQVSLDAVSGTDETSALELLIGLEPPVTGSPGPPGTTDRATFTPPRGAAEPVVGGGSFSTATPLDGSGAYADTVLPGEMVFYRVRLDWGAGLAYQLRLGEQDDINGIFVRTAWYSPARNELDSDSTAYDGKERTLPESSEAMSGPPVRYRNRELTDPIGPAVSVAGWYYISVLADLTDAQVPMTIDVSITGDTEPAPGYDGDAGQDPFGDESDRTAPRAAVAESGGFWSAVTDTGPLLWVGVPLLVLLAGATTGWLIVRRRRLR